MLAALSTSRTTTLWQLLTQLRRSSQPPSSPLLLGTHGATLNAITRSPENSWVTDPSASDHMFSHSYSMSSGRDKVTIANDTWVTIADQGSIRLSDHLTLSSCFISFNQLTFSE